MERLLLLLQEVGIEAPSSAPDAFAIVFGGIPLTTVLTTLEALRAEGVNVVLNPAGKEGPASPKSQFKKADASGARHALIFGPDELAQGKVAVKPLRESGEQALYPLDATGQWARKLKA